MRVINYLSRVPILKSAGILIVAGLMGLAPAAFANGADASMQQVMPLTVERTEGNDEPGMVFDAVSHTSVEIEAAPAAVWPHILDSNAWTGLSLIRREGPAGEVGEIFALFDPKNPERIRTVFAKILELVPERRRTFKIYDRTGRRSGYVTWTLQKIGERTLVLYDIYYQEFLSRDKAQSAGGDPTNAQLQERRSAMHEGDKAGLLRLKNLVESKSSLHEAR